MAASRQRASKSAYLFRSDVLEEALADDLKLFFQRARQRFMSADVLVVNHTLFFTLLGGLDEDAAAVAYGDIIEVGDVRLDAARHEVSVRGERVALPLKEFELLELLLANAGRVLTRDVLIDRVWGPNYYGDTKTLDVHVKRLRSKVEPDPAAPECIVTVRGVGYRYEQV